MNTHGPVEPDKDNIRQEPYTLPQGFTWDALDLGDRGVVSRPGLTTSVDRAPRSPRTQPRWLLLGPSSRTLLRRAEPSRASRSLPSVASGICPRLRLNSTQHLWRVES